MPNRRSFLKQLGVGSGLLLSGQFPFSSFAAGNSASELTILHTNDTHSQLDPFPATAARNAGQGGILARAAVIEQLRAQQSYVLLLDAGDFLQGTPYFDIYKGVPEIQAMNLLQYDAITIGAHDLDTGLDNLSGLLEQAHFPVVCANYTIDHPRLAQLVKPFTVVEKGGLRIGLFGIAGQPKGMLADHITAKIRYQDAIITAGTTAATLKKQHRCDMVICLSRLGLNDYYYRQLNDRMLARETEDIDLIIGGQSHTFLDKPLIVKNKKGKEVLITQAGWGGVAMGRLNYIFSDKKKILSANAQTVIIGK